MTDTHHDAQHGPNLKAYLIVAAALVFEHKGASTVDA